MEEDEVLVKVEGLSKKFCKDLKTSLWYGVQDLFANFRGNKKERQLRDKEFWAVQDISFELRRGECLGLIGHNGAGKSTLLKILNGLIKPDAGKVTIKGKVGALIELGAGFNPILTGRENIYNNGAILGFTRQEIDEKLDTIIDFAEIREFIDMSVQNYSSGMRVRLGFAVAAQMEPDVLLIDEVLAVGDLGFVLKCFKTIDAILPKTAIVFVSHSMPMISRMSTKAILMENGKSKVPNEDVATAIDIYYSRFAENASNTVFSDGSITFKEGEIVEPDGYHEKVPFINWNNDLVLYFSFYSETIAECPEFSIIIVDKEERPIGRLESNLDKSDILFNEHVYAFKVTHPKVQLSKGIYKINIVVRSGTNKEPLLRINSVLSFQIKHNEEIWEPFLLKSFFTTPIVNLSQVLKK